MTQEQFREIFDTHFERIRNYIYYRSGDKDLATDIAQDTFLKIWEKQPDHQKDQIRGLLYKIAGDIFISHYRRKKTAMNFRFERNSQINEETPEDKMRFQELNMIYDRALRDLPEKQRVVFLMSRIDNLKYHEIADNIGISIKAVEKRMNHALNHLKMALGKQ